MKRLITYVFLFGLVTFSSLIQARTVVVCNIQQGTCEVVVVLDDYDNSNIDTWNPR